MKFDVVFFFPLKEFFFVINFTLKFIIVVWFFDLWKVVGLLEIFGFFVGVLMGGNFNGFFKNEFE